MAIFLPKLQIKFAEFLKYGYSITLVFYQFTCVGFSTFILKRFFQRKQKA